MLEAERLACFYLTGLIWTIQLVHYPSFRFISEERFQEFHRFHSNRITWVVAPVMLVELFTAALVLREQATLASSLSLLSIVLIWALTAFVSVPLHSKLSKGKNSHLIRQLVLTNGFRTVLWTLRSLAFIAAMFF